MALTSKPERKGDAPTAKRTFAGDGLPARQPDAPPGVPLFLQPKLAISRPGDAAEREADRVAEGMGSNVPERAAGASVNPPPAGEAASPSNGFAPPIVHEVLGSPGRRLEPKVRAFMEPRLRADFSQVQVHTDAKAAESARQVDALAFTAGDHVVFGAGQYDPGTLPGQRLLAHELTHVSQQQHAGKAHVARKDEPAEAKPDNSYWFQTRPPEKKKVGLGGIEITPKDQVLVDPRTFTLGSEDLGSFSVRFAGKDSDFTDGKPKEEMKKAEEAILEAIKQAMEDLSALPDIKGAPSMKAALEQRKQDETVRARLKEPFRALAKKPLNVFIATQLTVGEMMSRSPLAFQTDQIYVRAEDLGDRSKLQAAIRVPLIALTGGALGFRSADEGEWEQTAAKALTAEQKKEALLHELMHVMLIERGASAAQLWDTVGGGMVKGPQPAKEAAEDLLRRYLRAQEEVFVYAYVGELYSEFKANKDRYELFLQLIEVLLESLSAKPTEVKKVKLQVSEKVGKKKEKVDWSISFKYPKSLTVAESDVTQLKEASKLDPGT